MYTEHGRKQRRNIEKLISEDEILKAVRPIVDKVPKVVSERVISTGVGAKGAFSAYNPKYAAKHSKGSHKDFRLSGNMWNSYQVVSEKVGSGIVSYELGTTSGKGSNGQYLSDIHSDTRRKHAKGGTQGESQLILDVTDEEWEKISDEMWQAILKTMNL